MSKPRILCVSFDGVVSEIRSGSLKDAGYDVTALTSISKALEFLNRNEFDAVIIGHRFAAKEKYLLAVEAKEKSNTPVLLVCGATADSQIPATSRVYALEGTTGLVSALSTLIPVEGAFQTHEAA